MRGRTTQSGPGPVVVPRRANREAPVEPTFGQGPIVDYGRHYRSRDVSAAQLWVDLDFLRQLKRYADTEQALLAFLTYQSKKAEPWMYLLLATCYELNGRDAELSRSAIAWAGYLARQKGDPFTLIEVADVMILRNLPEVEVPRAGIQPITAAGLLDLAYLKAPHRAEPILLGILLAEQTDDAEIMARAVERLMSLGWPGMDEVWRTEATQRAHRLAQKLQDQGKEEPARMLLERLRAAEPRDLFIRLTWEGDAGLELLVTEPLGATASASEPRTVFGGAVIAAGRGKNRESVYVCPRGFSGTYSVRVLVLYDNESDPARNAVLEAITHEGSPDEQVMRYPLDLANLEAIRIELKEGRRREVLPYQTATRLSVAPSLIGADEKEPRKKATLSRDPGRRAADALRAPDAAPQRSHDAPRR